MKRILIGAFAFLLGCEPSKIVVNFDTGPQDSDEDGYAAGDDDCDDSDSSTYSGAATYCDGNATIDRDCDGVPDGDACDDDGDGFTETGGDCNDGDVGAFPQETEYCGDPGAVDNDCDGLADEEDSDCDEEDTTAR